MLHILDSPPTPEVNDMSASSDSVHTNSVSVTAEPMLTLTAPFQYDTIKEKVIQLKQQDGSGQEITNTYSPKFAYMDGEGDLITISSEIELNEMVRQHQEAVILTNSTSTILDDLDEHDCVVLSYPNTSTNGSIEEKESTSESTSQLLPPPMTLTLVLAPTAPTEPIQTQPVEAETIVPAPTMSFVSSSAPISTNEDSHTSAMSLLVEVGQPVHGSVDVTDSTVTEVNSNESDMPAIDDSVRQLADEHSQIDTCSFVVLSQQQQGQQETSHESATQHEEVIQEKKEETEVSVTEPYKKPNKPMTFATFIILVCTALVIKMRQLATSVVKAGRVEYRRNPVWFTVQLGSLVVMGLALLIVLHAPNSNRSTRDLNEVVDSLTAKLNEAEFIHAKDWSRQQAEIDGLRAKLENFGEVRALKELKELQDEMRRSVNDAWEGVTSQVSSKLETAKTHLRALAHRINEMGGSVHITTNSFEERLYDEFIPRLSSAVPSMPTLSVPMLNLGSGEKWSEVKDSIGSTMQRGVDAVTAIPPQIVSSLIQVTRVAQPYGERIVDGVRSFVDEVGSWWETPVIRFGSSRSERVPYRYHYHDWE